MAGQIIFTLQAKIDEDGNVTDGEAVLVTVDFGYGSEVLLTGTVVHNLPVSSWESRFHKVLKLDYVHLLLSSWESGYAYYFDQNVIDHKGGMPYERDFTCGLMVVDDGCFFDEQNFIRHLKVEFGPSRNTRGGSTSE